MSWSWVYTEYSIHSWLSVSVSFSRWHVELWIVASATGMPSDMMHCHNSAFHTSSKYKSNCYISTVGSTSPRIVPAGQNGSIRVNVLCQSCQRHPGGGLLCARHKYHSSCCISLSDCSLTISSPTVSPIFSMNTLALWSIVTIYWNWFIWWVLASGLQCDGWRCDNLSSCSFNLWAKCSSLFSSYTHHSKLPNLCGYWQSIAHSDHLLSYH
jgi:hypothetical protein